jgi:hypothetical protein
VASLTESRAWVLARRPLLLALVLGFAISLIVSGRFSVRLIADGALSFAFVPLAELAGLALVYYLGRRVLPFAQAVDRFFSGNTAWLWWLLAIMTVTVVLPVMQHERLLAPLLLSLLIPIVLSVRHDLLYFRDVLGDTRARAWINVTLQRLVSWSAATAYFFGSALTSGDFFYLFVEIRDLIARWVSELA